ncbi:MAG: polysaccharide deacetylase family protein [Planctomycetales bacterium]
MTSGPAVTRDVALTFDDGPHPEYTPRLLDELAEHDIRATFFVVGNRAEQHPDLIRRIVAEGHELGHHSWTHSEPNQTSAGQLLDEVRWSIALLEDLTGKPSSLFRPPKGQLTWRKMRRLWELKQTIVLWNVDPRDYAMTDAGQIRAWGESYAPRAGDILLFHDNHPHCIEAVRLLARKPEFQRDWRFCPLTTWLPQSVATHTQPA